MTTLDTWLERIGLLIAVLFVSYYQRVRARTIAQRKYGATFDRPSWQSPFSRLIPFRNRQRDV